MVCRITFYNGCAHFSNRYVRTPGYIEEKKAGKILYRGVFGTQKPGGCLANFFYLKNKEIANTNVIYWGDKLLALWEASEPYRLDPYTFDTLGKDYLEGALGEGEAFSAHSGFDPNGGKPCLVNFSIKPNGLSTTITVFELDITGKVMRKHAHAVLGFAFIHDFAITPNYCIFFQNPVNFNPIPFLLGTAGAAQCIKFQAQKPTRALIIPRNPKNREIKTLETQSGFIFHHVNAFERGDEIIMDSVCYESLPEIEAGTDFRQADFDANAPGKLWRFHLNIKDGAVSKELMEDRCCEFPSIHRQNVGREYRYLYIGVAHSSTGNAPFQRFQKIDLETEERQIWSTGRRGFAGEPLFIPRPNATDEDDGWVLAVILDAKDLSREPIARLHLKHHIPYALHGSFTDKVFIE